MAVMVNDVDADDAHAVEQGATIRTNRLINRTPSGYMPSTPKVTLVVHQPLELSNAVSDVAQSGHGACDIIISSTADTPHILEL